MYFVINMPIKRDFPPWVYWSGKNAFPHYFFALNL